MSRRVLILPSLHALVTRLRTRPDAAITVISCLGAIASTWASLAWLAHPLAWLLVLAVSLLASLRIGSLAVASREGGGRNRRTIANLEATSGVALCLLLGKVAALCLVLSAPASAQVLSTGSALFVGLALAIGRIGQIGLALAKIGCAFGPVFVASLWAAEPAMSVLAAILPCITFSAVWLTRALHRDRSRRLAVTASSRRYAAEMRRQSRCDPVTGLANRTGFELALRRLAKTTDGGAQLALLWIDLKRFKQVNEALGHASGDEVLRVVARRLREATHTGAAIARFAGDEFLVAAHTRSRPEAEKLAQAMVDEVGRVLVIGGQRVAAGASLGAALLPEDADTPDALLQAADLARCHAKSADGHAVRFFTPSMSRELARRKEIECELRSAIQRDELAVYFQPIVDLATGRIRRFEALVRWFHPEKGELRPDEFIPVAEETGLIITLGNWVTAQAAKAASFWPEDVTLSVNLSPAQIRAPGAALGIMAALREAGLPPSRLELEVTESLFLEENASTATFMETLAARGVGFALDDFGTGYSSLRYIHRHPFRTIKVDRSFISGMGAGVSSDAIVRAVAGMGRSLDMEIVAEGLETLEQVRATRRAGCTLGQGWYFSRAVPDFAAAILLSEEDRDKPVGKVAWSNWRAAG